MERSQQGKFDISKNTRMTICSQEAQLKCRDAQRRAEISKPFFAPVIVPDTFCEHCRPEDDAGSEEYFDEYGYVVPKQVKNDARLARLPDGPMIETSSNPGQGCFRFVNLPPEMRW
ncbi:hypothetical protein LTR37_006323 [Vermiconidia calcicola]|uniref:Uncharacterized protein n=1 Tax=Vermiconidia calcicola TaxID=1690605 RepID=A0ACC3NH76_9PEZI|nr:hypothetical protein LTR37_006323 [Vermiconidia calcicola]